VSGSPEQITLRIDLPANRDYVGVLRVLDSSERVLAGPYRIAARASSEIAAEHGNPTRATTLPYGDPPLGTYKCQRLASTGEGTKYRQDLFGFQDVIVLTGTGGNAALADANGRFEILIHGGPLTAEGALRMGTGHFRISDPDLHAVTDLIRQAQATSCICEQGPRYDELDFVSDSGIAGDRIDKHRPKPHRKPRVPVGAEYLVAYGEYGPGPVPTGEPGGTDTTYLDSPSLPPAGQPGQVGTGMDTISQSMQYATALSQDSYVDPYSGVQYPTSPLLTDPLNGGPSPYYPGGQSMNSYDGSAAASPGGQTPDLYTAFQNFTANSAPGSGYNSSVSPFFPGAGGTPDTSQMWASNGPTPGPDSIPSNNGSVYMPIDVVQGQNPIGLVTRNGEQDVYYQIPFNGVVYDVYFNDASTQIPLNMVEVVPTSSRVQSNAAAPAAPRQGQPIPAAPAPPPRAAAPQPPQPAPAPYNPWANENWLSRWINSGSGGLLQNDRALANLQNSILQLTVYTEVMIASGALGYALGSALGESALLNATSWQAFRAALIPIGGFVTQQLYTFNTGALPLASAAPPGALEEAAAPSLQRWSFSTASGQPTLVLGEGAPSLGYVQNPIVSDPGALPRMSDSAIAQAYVNYANAQRMINAVDVLGQDFQTYMANRANMGWAQGGNFMQNYTSELLAANPVTSQMWSGITQPPGVSVPDFLHTGDAAGMPFAELFPNNLAQWNLHSNRWYSPFSLFLTYEQPPRGWNPSAAAVDAIQGK
jgi:hypothetical protein